MPDQTLSRYDRQREHDKWWAVAKCTYAFTALVCIVGFVWFVANVWAPYTDFVDARLRTQEKAAIYLKTDVCTNAKTRAQLETYNKCEESEKTLSRSANLDAFYDLMQSLSICNNERCVVFGFNITEILPRLALVVCAVFSLVFACSLCGYFNASYRYHAGMMQMPYAGQAYAIDRGKVE